MSPSPLNEDNRVLKSPHVIDVLQLHVEHLQIVSLRILRRLPILKQVPIRKSHGSIIHQIFTPFLDVDNPIIEQFERRDHIDDSMLIFCMRLHGIVVVGEVGKDRTLENALNGIDSTEFIVMQLEHLQLGQVLECDLLW